eukprot:9504008-Pyramimonas_sp.AAC.1
MTRKGNNRTPVEGVPAVIPMRLTRGGESRQMGAQRKEKPHRLALVAVEARRPRGNVLHVVCAHPALTQGLACGHPDQSEAAQT